MAIKNESFLVLEQSLANNIVGNAQEYSNPLFKKVGALVDKEEFIKAENLISTYDPAEAVGDSKVYAYNNGYQALLFGAREFKASKNTVFAKEGPPLILDTSTDALLRGITDSLKLNVVPACLKMINEQEEIVRDSKVQKAEAKGFARRIQMFGNQTQANGINIGASLHTSRLASWGFLVEAEVVGSTRFLVSAILDGRTSDICELMNGKTFQTGPAMVKLERLLSVDNIMELKTLAPFPGTSPAAIAEIKRMNESELQAAGFDTPPYHPYCRTILRRYFESVVNNTTSVTDVLALLSLLTSQLVAPEPAQ